KEKGVDVALAVDALQVGLEGKIDIAILVTGDGDLVPLSRALMKHGIRVGVIYFEYESEYKKSFANERLLNACNYALNINRLEKDRRYQSLFRGLFRQPERNKEESLLPLQELSFSNSKH
ncbi:MAG: NYN domain-containing protein, partial [Blastocatellia bacterium]|nr:NYN domain-containing protein [Blastocatellia bacterium]